MDCKPDSPKFSISDPVYIGTETLKQQGRVGKQSRFYRSFPGSEQVVKGNREEQAIELLLQVILSQASLEVTLGKDKQRFKNIAKDVSK